MIHTGSCEILLKAKNIAEKVKWFNLLKETQSKIVEAESQKFVDKEDLITHLGEKMNEKLATRIFGRFDPIYEKIGECWNLQAEMEESFSNLEPEMRASEKLRKECQNIGESTNSLKILVAEILEDLEVT